MVKVIDSHGKEVMEAPVTLVERSGRAVHTRSQRGGVRFCDLGLWAVSVTIGGAHCYQVQVRDVPLLWGETQNITILYDGDVLCDQDTPPVAACKILFRVQNEHSRWISKAVLDPPFAGSEQSASDNYGRLLIRIAAGARLDTFVKRDGYVPEKINLTCTSDLQFAEKILTLRQAR
jgi:hypothetical protein